jgi:hypothetical protein
MFNTRLPSHKLTLNKKSKQIHAKWGQILQSFLEINFLLDFLKTGPEMQYGRMIKRLNSATWQPRFKIACKRGGKAVHKSVNPDVNWGC